MGPNQGKMGAFITFFRYERTPSLLDQDARMMRNAWDCDEYMQGPIHLRSTHLPEI